MTASGRFETLVPIHTISHLSTHIRPKRNISPLTRLERAAHVLQSLNKIYLFFTKGWLSELAFKQLSEPKLFPS